MMPGALLAEPLRVIEDSDTVFEIAPRFDRGTGLRQTWLRGQTEETLALAALERVEPRAGYAPRNGRSSVELYLVQKTDDGQHDTLIPMARSNPEDVNRMVAFITSWVSSMRKDSLT